MKKLPIGTQSFEVLRTEDLLYVDKTEDIHRLITNNRIIFLSRPRRFGKSLLVSTLDAVFSGRKELFEGLWIYDKWDWTRQFPVIRIDWTRISHSDPEEMKGSLASYVRRIADNYQIQLVSASASDCFSELIEKLHRKTGEKVVILIDEYDKPVTSHLLDEHLEPVRMLVHDFYQVMKGADEHIRFIFLTGVSKFAGLSVFSALNNPNDITLTEKYATICGYTQPELENYFTEYIDDTAQHLEMTRDELLSLIRTWYNGYSWDGKTAVYNPFSTLLFFDNQEFANYWFRTGTPTFLIRLIRKGHETGRILTPVTISANAFDSYDPKNIRVIPLMFQTGYLTIKKKILEKGRPLYTLEFPNAEVGEALMEQLFYAYTSYPVEETEDLRQRMWRQLRDHNTEGLEQCLREMIAAIPYLEVVKTEAWYHSVMLLWLRLLGFELTGELPTNFGRIDAVWFFPGHAIIVEVKSQPKQGDISKLLDAALKQIHEKRYYERFMGERQVSLLGVAFAGNEIGCRIESLLLNTSFP
ncbi:MAG: ATP-binding protein [Bacteroidales bacterium]|jgi:hypothetical protein|nr:ATP-binding protein [Bacteroidales bacterium]